MTLKDNDPSRIPTKLTTPGGALQAVYKNAPETGRVRLVDVRDMIAYVPEGSLSFTGEVDTVTLKALLSAGKYNAVTADAFRKALGCRLTPYAGKSIAFQRNPFAEPNRLKNLITSEWDYELASTVTGAQQADGKISMINGLGRIVRALSHGLGQLQCEIFGNISNPLSIPEQALLFERYASTPKALKKANTVHALALADPRSQEALILKLLEKAHFKIDGNAKDSFGNVACLYDALSLHDDAKHRDLVILAFDVCRVAWPKHQLKAMTWSAVYGVIDVICRENEDNFDFKKMISSCARFPTPLHLLKASLGLTKGKVPSNEKPAYMAQMLVFGSTTHKGGYNWKLGSKFTKVSQTALDRGAFFTLFARRQASNHAKR